MSFDITKYERVIIDFDGVLTNNKVYINETGEEIVRCSRADGLAFDVLAITGFEAIIFSTEKNDVVSVRGKKLNIPTVPAVKDKESTLLQMAKKKSWDLSKTIYIGNDLNDFLAMKLCGLSVCPSDAHYKVKSISDVILKTEGGNGVMRELLEEIFDIDFLAILYRSE